MVKQCYSDTIQDPAANTTNDWLLFTINYLIILVFQMLLMQSLLLKYKITINVNSLFFKGMLGPQTQKQFFKGKFSHCI